MSHDTPHFFTFYINYIACLFYLQKPIACPCMYALQLRYVACCWKTIITKPLLYSIHCRKMLKRTYACGLLNLCDYLSLQNIRNSKILDIRKNCTFSWAIGIITCFIGSQIRPNTIWIYYNGMVDRNGIRYLPSSWLPPNYFKKLKFNKRLHTSCRLNVRAKFPVLWSCCESGHLLYWGRLYKNVAVLCIQSVCM